jgi:hypothetical protein
LAYPADRLILRAEEIAVVDGTVGFDWPDGWMNISYKQAGHPPVNLPLQLSLGLGETSDTDIMPLAGPAVITLNTNLPEDGPPYTGAAGIRIVRTDHKSVAFAGLRSTSEFGHYYTLTSPADKVTLRANEAAIIVGTTNICEECNWMNILYKKGDKDFVNMILPLGFTDGTMPLSGPGVVMLNTNDADFYGAAYTGALQLKVIHIKREEASGNYYTLAYPDDRLVLKANETAIIDGTLGFDWPYSWANILYQRGTNDSTNMILPLGLTGGTMPLSGPCVIRLNTNDVSVFGALYTGAVGVRVVRTIDRNRLR